MKLLEGIETKRSFRAFKSTPVPGGILKRILGVASKSLYHTNTQPWEVALTSGNKKESSVKSFMKCRSRRYSKSRLTATEDLAALIGEANNKIGGTEWKVKCR